MVPLVVLPSCGSSQAPEAFPQIQTSFEAENPPQSEPKIKKEVTRIFEPVWEDGVCTFVLNEAVRAADRKRLAEDVEPILHEHRLLTDAEMKDNGLIELQPDKMYYFKVPSGRHPGIIRLSAKWLKKHGFLDRLAALREFSLEKEFREKLMYLCKRYNSGSWKKRGTAYTLSTTTNKHYGTNTIQLGKLLNHADELPGVKKYLLELTSLIAEVTQLAFPDIETRGRAERRYENASLTFGAKKNRQFTSVQLNYSEENASLEDSLKVSGGVHRDRMNDPTLPGVLVSMSHHSEDYFTGRFNIRCLHATVPLLPFEIIIFSARFYHCSTGGGFYNVPKSSPLRVPPSDPRLIPVLPSDFEHSRLNFVLYPAIRLMKLSFSEIRIELFDETVEGMLFEDKAHHYEWMMRTYIVNEPEIVGRLKTVPNHVPIPKDGRSQMIVANVEIVKKGEAREARVEFGLGITRNGDPDHYVRLFEFTDPETGERRKPDRSEAVKTLRALAKPNIEYEELEKDMRYLDPCDYGNSGCPKPVRRSVTGRLRGKNQFRKRNQRVHETSGSENEYEEEEDDSDFDVQKSTEVNGEMESGDEAVLNGERGEAHTGAAKVLAPALNEFNAAIDMLKEAGLKLFAFAFQQSQLLGEANAKLSAQENSQKIAPRPRDTSGSKSTDVVRNKKPVKTNSARLMPSPKVEETDSPSSHKKRKHGATPLSTPPLKPPKRVKKGVFSLHADPVYVDDEEQWEVESIVGKRPTKSGKPLYRARWKGYSPEWDEWMTTKDLENCKELIEEYESKWGFVTSIETD
ncbi:hypothetical protein ONS96_003937 [Cadophora gregata f. sp. sojae]|nr:hypothetical protein ONS96_003937 [Cadophora gregata f. sp. sojae]